MTQRYSPYAVFYKKSLICLEVVYDYILTAKETSLFKKYPITEEQAIEIRKLLWIIDSDEKANKIQRKIFSIVFPAECKVRRNSNSEAFKKDKADAIKYVIEKGGSSANAAKYYNLNNNSVRGWVKKAREAQKTGLKRQAVA